MPLWSCDLISHTTEMVIIIICSESQRVTSSHTESHRVRKWSHRVRNGHTESHRCM